MTQLYDTDFSTWTQEMARLLRERDIAALDWENIAEEIESMGKRDYRGLGSRMRILLILLLKWRYQDEKRSRSWRSTICAPARMPASFSRTGGAGQQNACDGFCVIHKRMTELFRDLAAAHADGSIGRVQLKLSRIDVLVLDDFAMAPLKDNERRDFLEICDDRYQRRS
jgi:hypothetical protein